MKSWYRRCEWQLTKVSQPGPLGYGMVPMSIPYYSPTWYDSLNGAYRHALMVLRSTEGYFLRMAGGPYQITWGRKIIRLEHVSAPPSKDQNYGTRRSSQGLDQQFNYIKYDWQGRIFAHAFYNFQQNNVYIWYLHSIFDPVDGVLNINMKLVIGDIRGFWQTYIACMLLVGAQENATCAACLYGDGKRWNLINLRFQWRCGSPQDPHQSEIPTIHALIQASSL